MRQSVSRASGVALVAFGILGFGTGAALANGSISGSATVQTTPTPSTFFAPLWVYPPSQGSAPIMITPPAPGGPNVLVIREEPSLLRPADLHFTTDEENGVTVVRGPLAR